MKNKFKKLLEEILSTILMFGFVGICLCLTAFVTLNVGLLLYKLTSFIWGWH